MMFADLPLDQQIDAWLGLRSHAPIVLRSTGDVAVHRATLGRHTMIVVAFDYTRRYGSIGPAEAVQIAEALQHAVAEQCPLVFLMNTSGMRVTEGMGTVAALRNLLRALLDARLTGQRLFAVITRHAFGGASMIASLCDRRIMHAGSLLAMSGPKLIEKIAGGNALRASDADAVAALMGGAARAAVSGTTLLCDDSPDAYRAALASWLGDALSEPMVNERIAVRMQALRTCLGDRALKRPQAVAMGTLDADTVRVIGHILPGVPAVTRSGSVVFARGSGSDTAIVCGFIGGGAATAPAIFAVADELFAAAGNRAGLQISILADVENHSADPADERVILSEYLAHLALTLRLLHRRGNDVHVIVTGVAGGGIFAALAAGATRVSMLPTARIQVLSPAALAALDKRADTDCETLESALAAGAVDSAFASMASNV